MDYFLGAYWGPLRQDKSVSATKLTQLFKEVSKLSGDFSFLENRFSNFDDLSHFNFEDNTSDFSSEPIPSLGHSFKVWNEDKTNSILVSGFLGVYEEALGIGNSLQFETSHKDIDPTLMLKIMDIVVKVFTPDYAVLHDEVTETDMLDALAPKPIYLAKGIKNYVKPI